MTIRRILLIACLAIFAGSTASAQTFKYIGAPKCKMCHNKPNKGAQYDVWLEGPHANAMESLSTDEAKTIASEKGIADPTTDVACTKCHSTVGHIDAGLKQGIVASEGVSCESCHGPGSMYKGASVMKNREQALQKGMIDPTEEVCISCHNAESPTFKGFDFAEYSAKIAHPDPTLQ